MKRLMIFLSMLVVLIFIGTAHGQTIRTVTGVVLELDRNAPFIQVRDYTYRVEMVLVDFGGEAGPVMGGMTDLDEGSLVEVYVKSRDEGFWIAEKVIVFKGSKKEEVLKTLK